MRLLRFQTMDDRHNLASDHNLANDRHSANRRGCHRARPHVAGVRLAAPDVLPGGCENLRAHGNSGRQIAGDIRH